MSLTQVSTSMVKDFNLPEMAINIGDVLTFDGTKWIAQPGVPAGTILQFAGTVAPSGWLLCNGAAISRASYAGLFAALGIAYGAGNGSTTFNLPDLRGRVPVGLDNMGGTSANRITAPQADSLGGSGGLEVRVPTGTVSLTGTVGETTLSINQLPNHSHNYDKDTWYQGSGGLNGSTSMSQSSATSSVGNGVSHSHSFSGSGSLTGANMDITQPWLAINYIIKV